MQEEYSSSFGGEIQPARETDQLHVGQRQPLHFRVITGAVAGFEVKARHQVFHVPVRHRTVAIGRGAEALLEHAGKGLLRVEAQLIGNVDDGATSNAQRHRGARQDTRTDVGGELNAGNTLEFTLQMPLGIARNTRDFIQVWPFLQMYLHPLN